MRYIAFTAGSLLIALATTTSAAAQSANASLPGESYRPTILSDMNSGAGMGVTWRRFSDNRAPATPADIQPGLVVRDWAGHYIGRVAAITPGSVVVRFRGDRTAALAPASFWRLSPSLMLQMSRAEFDRMASLQ